MWLFYRTDLAYVLVLTSLAAAVTPAVALDYALSGDGSAVVRLTNQQPLNRSNFNSSLLTSEYSGWIIDTSGLSGNVSISDYDAGWVESSGGGEIQGRYLQSAAISKGSTLNWVQFIDTNYPVGGTTTPYIDPRPNDDTLPFYWTTSEVTTTYGGSKSVSFYDYSRRLIEGLNRLGLVTWEAQLFPVIYDGAQGIKVGDGILWGWEIKKATVGSVSATFTSPTPGTAVTAGTGTSTFRWGTGNPSSLSFSAARFDTKPGDIFKLGTLNFQNGIIENGSEANSVIFNANVSFDNIPELNTVTITRFNLVNTPNTDDPVASADYVSLGSYNYTFNVLEGGSASIDLLGRLTTGLILTPTDSSHNDKIIDGEFDESPSFSLVLAGLGMPIGDGFIGDSGIDKLFWDGNWENNANNDEIDGGDSIWNTVATNWTNATGDKNSAYASTTASFSGDGGVVTVDESTGEVTVPGMQFISDGYLIQGDPLILDGDVVVVQVGDYTTAGAGITATIGSELTGAATLSKIDKGSLYLTAVNTYTGGTIISDGTVIGTGNSFGTGEIYNDATLVIDQSGEATLTNSLDGRGSLTKRGTGTLILSGSDERTGLTIVESGLLKVEGVIFTSLLTVQADGTLGGNGVVDDVSLEMNAVVTPGASIGTLTVLGDYSQASHSTYTAEISSTGSADRLQISGAATISPDAVLNVVRIDAGQIPLDSRYTLLTAAGGLTGEYELAGDTNVSAFIHLVDNYDANNVYLDALQMRTFASAGLTQNQLAVGNAADTGQGALIQALANLPTIDAAREAFDQISGEIYPSIATLGFEDSRFIREAALDRLSATDDSDTVWAKPFGTLGRMGQYCQCSSGTSRDIRGLIIGGEIASGDYWRMGIMGGFSHSNVDVDKRSSSARSDNYHIGIYGEFQHSNVTAQLGAAISKRHINTRRRVNFQGFNNMLEANYNSDLIQLFGEVDYRLDSGLRPFVGLAVMMQHTDHVTEQGGASALSRGSSSENLIATMFGLKGSKTIEYGDNKMASLSGRIGWIHSEGDIQSRARFTIANSDPFTINGIPITRNALGLLTGITIPVGDGKFSLEYSGRFAEGIVDNSVKATVAWHF